MNYGTDIKLGDDRDLVFLPAGDVETISGGALVAQDIAEEASIPRGSVKWDLEAGSELYNFLNDPTASEEGIIQELERLALKDPRVDASSVRGSRLEDGRFQLVFRPLSAVTQEALRFDLADLFGGGNE
ncbi:hypothetical protein [Sediminispirochaeta bajacaliforniensis]|uniref:hypothetical protein n=1 Tax=Sediminispirochaeta bajacaliforniensis TaxID=148 RepID=UPI0003826145|nr:hypothetical protein [Sediminispirochaeta bajacaliforniensis]